MATPKPVFLYSNFWRAVRSCRPQTYSSLRHANFHNTVTSRQQETNYQRYGPAASPSLPPPPKPSEPYLPSSEQVKNDAVELETKQPEQQQQSSTEAVEEPQQQQQQHQQSASQDPKADEAAQPELKPEDLEGPLPNRELDIVLSVPSPSEVKGETHRHPHLEAPPYEHHFDTYTLVQELSQDAFTQHQAVTLMKSIRLMLAQNLDMAKDGLVSKSDTENETYLFNAACSELRTTMQTSRFMEAQKQRTQRAQLQHEYDILNQKVSQDIMTMREELKAMFNDRKLGMQEEKRKVDGNIQELSYQISVDLNSEAKSEVEGLRWVLTRRAALAIGAAASMVLAFLQYYSVKSREQAEIDKKRKAAQKARNDMVAQEQARFTTPSRTSGTQTEPARSYEESLG